MSDKFKGITNGPGLQLEQAVERNGGSMEDIDWLCARTHFDQVVKLRRRLATLTLRESLDDETKKSLIVRVGQSKLKYKWLSAQPSGINRDVDYDKPLGLLIEEAGCNIDEEDFREVDLLSFRRESERGVKRLWFEVIYFSDWHITPEFVSEEFKVAGLRSATFVEGLNFIGEVGMFGNTCASIHLLGSLTTPVVPVKNGLGKWFRNKIMAPTYHTRVSRLDGPRNVLRATTACRSGTEWDDFFLAVHI